MSNKHSEIKELEGLVTHRAGDRIVVETSSGIFTCTIAKKNKFHHKTYGGVLVGDNVRIHVANGVIATTDVAAIVEVYPRKNAFFRGNPENVSDAQGIATNLDRIFIIAAVEDRTTPFGLIDRILVATENCEEVERVLVWNKIDLMVSPQNFMQSGFNTIYQRVGYRVIGISTKQATQDELLALFPDGRTLLIGPSGVGKSSLLNRLFPNLDLATNPISHTSGKGVHTTSVAHLYRLPNGAEIIDTPGFKSFILNGVTNEPVYHFPEFQPYLQKCKFADCKHDKDKGCAIRAAVKDGTISESRYHSYLSLLNETNTDR